jgi:c-di-GMP-binding flagellar brake protein YcgR
MIANLIALYPLQVSATDFNFDNNISPRGLIIFGIVVAAFVIFIVIINMSKRGTGGGGSSKLFSGFALHRLARNAGLNREQIKMLDYAFRIDDAVDPEKSLSNPSLLDRHFRRAYRVIETTNSDQETLRKHAILFSTRNVLENSSIGTISSTRQLRDDISLIINNGKDKLNINVLSTKAENLVAESPKNILGSQVKIAKGTKLNVLFFTKANKGFTFETRVTGYTNYHGHQAMLLAHSNQIKFLSQRRYRRKQTNIACFMSLVYIEGSGKKQRMIVDKRRFNGNIADISVGGCSIKTNGPVKVGARFKIEFSQGDNNLAALGQILRTNKAGVNTVAHIKFLRVTQKSMNLINAFVYDYSNE